MKVVTKILIKVFIWIIIALAAASALYFGWKKFSEIKVEKMHTAVSRTLEQTAELSLYKMSYTDIIAIKKKAAMGLAKSYSIVKYSGIIRCGIKNASDISFTISDDRKSISLSVPPCEVLSNDITSENVFDDHNNVFVPISTQEIFDEINSAKTEALTELLNDGLLDEADKRAELLIRQFMITLGFENISIAMK